AAPRRRADRDAPPRVGHAADSYLWKLAGAAMSRVAGSTLAGARAEASVRSLAADRRRLPGGHSTARRPRCRALGRRSVRAVLRLERRSRPRARRREPERLSRVPCVAATLSRRARREWLDRPRADRGASRRRRPASGATSDSRRPRRADAAAARAFRPARARRPPRRALVRPGVLRGATARPARRRARRASNRGRLGARAAPSATERADRARGAGARRAPRGARTRARGAA